MYNVEGDVMKKILLCLVGLLLFTGCGRKDYTYLSYTDLDAKLNNKDDFVLVIGSSTCTACDAYEETMRDIITKNDIEIFFLDLNTLSDEESSKVYSKFVYSYTPTTIFIKNGEETGTHNRIVGAGEYKDVLNKLEQLGYIGE